MSKLSRARGGPEGVPDEWLLFKKLPDYAPHTKRKQVDVIQLPLPDTDENQQRGSSSV